MFVLVSNFMGMLPFRLHGDHQIAVTFALAAIVILLMIVTGFSSTASVF